MVSFPHPDVWRSVKFPLIHTLPNHFGDRKLAMGPVLYDGPGVECDIARVSVECHSLMIQDGQR